MQRKNIQLIHTIKDIEQNKHNTPHLPYTT